MLRRMIGLLLALSLVSLLIGCWNRREMNELAIAVGMGIDKVGDKYSVSVQVVIPGEVASQKAAGHTPVTLYKTEATTIMEACRKLTTISPRKIYFSHLRLLVFGESLAREGLRNTLDFVSRDHEFRDDFYLLVARDNSAENVLKINTSLVNIPAIKLFASIEASEKFWAPTLTVTPEEMITSLLSDGKQPILPGLRFIGDQQFASEKKSLEQIESPGILQLSGIAVFKKDRLIGWLNEDESRGMNFILNNVHHSARHISCPNGDNVTLEIIRSQTKLKGKVSGGQPRIEIGIRIEGNVGEVACRGLDLTKTKTLAELEKIVERGVTNIIDEAIEKAQKKYKADIFGFGETIHRANPKAWKSLKQDWDERYFPQLPVNINVHFTIRRMGTIGDSFLNKMKE